MTTKRMLSEGFEYVENDVILWLKRYKFWYKKILKAEKDLESIIKIDVGQSTFAIILTFWVYISPLGMPDKERKNLGKWIMKLIGKEEPPKEVEINSQHDRCFRFSNTVKDDNGVYDIIFNLVI